MNTRYWIVVLVIGPCIAAVAGTSIPTTRPTTQQAAGEYAREVSHLDRVMGKLAKHREMLESPYIRLDLAVARRFLDRLRAPSAAMLQQAIWAKPQMEGVG